MEDTVKVSLMEEKSKKLINLILSIKSLVSRNKPPVGYKGMAVTNLVLSIAGPVLYGLTCLLNLLDPGV